MKNIAFCLLCAFGLFSAIYAAPSVKKEALLFNNKEVGGVVLVDEKYFAFYLDVNKIHNSDTFRNAIRDNYKDSGINFSRNSNDSPVLTGDEADPAIKSSGTDKIFSDEIYDSGDNFLWFPKTSPVDGLGVMALDRGESFANFSFNLKLSMMAGGRTSPLISRLSDNPLVFDKLITITRNSRTGQWQWVVAK
jgi:hypothetical protein